MHGQSCADADLIDQGFGNIGLETQMFGILDLHQGFSWNRQIADIDPLARYHSVKRSDHAGMPQQCLGL